MSSMNLLLSTIIQKLLTISNSIFCVYQCVYIYVYIHFFHPEKSSFTNKETKALKIFAQGYASQLGLELRT